MSLSGSAAHNGLAAGSSPAELTKFFRFLAVFGLAIPADDRRTVFGLTCDRFGL
jgi:hypothetical protein